MFIVVVDKVVTFKHATLIPAREVLAVKAINMHVFFATLKLKSILVRGMFLYKYFSKDTVNLV